MGLIYLASFIFLSSAGFFALTQLPYYYPLNQFLKYSYQKIRVGTKASQLVDSFGYAIPQIEKFPKTNTRSYKKSSTYKVCPRCGKKLRKINGKYGLFFGCTGYPECEYTQNIK